MKGLIIKDLYMIKKYCKLYIIFVILSAAAAAIGSYTNFFICYPIIILSALPGTLIAYDEHEKWNLYCDALPVTRRQSVSSKYVIGFFSILLGGLLVFVIQLISHFFNSGFETERFNLLMIISLGIGFLSTAVTLPFIFKLGAEKGRIIRIGAIIILCIFCNFADNVPESVLPYSPALILPFILAASLLIYIISWIISIKLYSTREL